MTEEKKKKKPNEQEMSVSKSEDVIQADQSEDIAEKIEVEEDVTIPLKDYAAQLEEIDHLKQQSDEFSEGWQRERAEFANFRKRVSRDQEQDRLNFRIDMR